MERKRALKGIVGLICGGFVTMVIGLSAIVLYGHDRNDYRLQLGLGIGLLGLIAGMCAVIWLLQLAQRVKGRET